MSQVAHQFSFQPHFGVTNLHICLSLCVAIEKPNCSLMQHTRTKSISPFEAHLCTGIWRLYHQIRQPRMLVIPKELQNTEHERLHMDITSASSLQETKEDTKEADEWGELLHTWGSTRSHQWNYHTSVPRPTSEQLSLYHFPVSTMVPSSSAQFLSHLLFLSQPSLAFLAVLMGLSVY